MLLMLRFSLLYWLVLIFVSSADAQSLTFRTPSLYSIEAGTYLSSSTQTPFWLRSNEYGIVPLKSPAGTLRASATTDYDTSRTHHGRFDYGYGISAVYNAGATVPSQPNQLLLPEVYVKARFGILEAYVGRRREQFALGDTLLTSGAYAWSGNALPIPKIQIGISQFTPLKFTKGWVSVKGTFAHGWMDPGLFVQHALLHQKTFYIRIGQPQSIVKILAGINHQVIWGGKSPQLVAIGLTKSEILPSSFADYLLVVSGLRTGDSGIIDPTQMGPYTDFDFTNRVGNHLGSIDFAADIDLVRHSLFLYRQNPYDSGAIFYLTSIADGLNGIRIRRNDPDAFVHDILIEYLSTMSQGGNEFVIDDPKRRGRVDYFNNAQFRDGWSYYSQTIGTPFIPPALGPNGESPYNIFTTNNRVKVVHIGVSGSLPQLNLAWLNGRITYNTKLSLSQNYGLYQLPYASALTQFSARLNLAAPLTLLSGSELIGALAFDTGQLYPDAIGMYLGLRKTWRKRP